MKNQTRAEFTFHGKDYVAIEMKSAKGHHLKELYVVDENGLENYIGDLSKIHQKGTTRAMKDHIAELTIAAENALEGAEHNKFNESFAQAATEAKEGLTRLFSKSPTTQRSAGGTGHGHKAIVRDCCKQLAICRRVGKSKKRSKK